MIVDHAREKGETLPETAPALPAHLPLGVELLGRSVAVPALGLGGGAHDWSWASRSHSTDCSRSHGQKLSRRDSSRSPSARVRSCRSRSRSSDRYRDQRVYLGSRSDRSLSRRLRSRLTGRCEARRDRSRSHGSRYRSRDHRRSLERSPSSDCSRSGKRSWRLGQSRRNRAEAVDASRNRGNCGLTVEPAHAAAGGSTALPTSSFPNLVRLVLSLSGSVDQWGVVLGSLLSAAAVTGAGGVPAPAATVPSAAPVACSSSVPISGAPTPAGSAPVTTSSSRHERAQKSSRPEKRHRQSSGRERSRSGGKRGGGRSPSPTRSAHLASVSASSSSESSDSEGRVSAIPPPPSSRPGAGGDRSASGRACSPQAGPSGLGSGVQAVPCADWSRSELLALQSFQELVAGSYHPSLDS